MIHSFPKFICFCAAWIDKSPWVKQWKWQLRWCRDIHPCTYWWCTASDVVFSIIFSSSLTGYDRKLGETQFTQFWWNVACSHFLDGKQWKWQSGWCCEKYLLIQDWWCSFWCHIHQFILTITCMLWHTTTPFNLLWRPTACSWLVGFAVWEWLHRRW